MHTARSSSEPPQASPEPTSPGPSRTEGKRSGTLRAERPGPSRPERVLAGSGTERQLWPRGPSSVATMFSVIHMSASVVEAFGAK